MIVMHCSLGKVTAIYCFLSTVLEVSFTQELYNASESDGVVRILFAYSGILERQVQVEIFTEDIDAEEGADYQNVSITITLNENSMDYMVSIPLEEDNRLENDEFFRANLASTDDVVMFGLASSVIRIVDSNRKQALYLLARLYQSY